MSSENEEQVLLKSEKKSKLSYTRDFLLSLSELDACKKLPDGFDASILSGFEDFSNSTFERQRNVGGFSLQSSKRGEYGSAPQTRGNQGKWETRSSGSSDKDVDLQSDWESTLQDSGRRLGNQNRRYGQNSEHDGLLGSGAFPRPTGYIESSAPKGRGNGQLSRNIEPYQPPRPYKAMPFSRKDITDSFNDETFGSAECSSEDRAEEERKRRASFELIRKEQQKALQEKQKQKLQNLDSRKENLDVDIVALLGSSNKSDEPVAASLSYNNSSRSSLHSQAPAPRPLVPPGFACAPVERNPSVQAANTSFASEVGAALAESKHSLSGMENNADKGNIPVASLPVSLEKNAPKGSRSSGDANAESMVPNISVEVLNEFVNIENIFSKKTAQETDEVWEDDIIIMDDSSCKRAPTSEVGNKLNQNNSTTILEKLFSSALSKKHVSSHDSVEHKDVKADEEKSSLAAFEASKFAHWFSNEEKKQEGDFSSRELSLIVSNEKTGPQLYTSNEKDNEHTPLNPSLKSVVAPLKFPTSPAIIEVPEKSPSSAVLTCEDLEQSILAEVKDNNESLHHSHGSWGPLNGKSEKRKTAVDDHASQHLLSLLQKGTSLKEFDITESSGKASGSHANPSFAFISDDGAVKNPEIAHSSERSLTLEALFGASFMNALHSAEAPVSAQRGSVGTVNNTGESRSNKIIHEGDMLPIEERGTMEIQLPEEDSLILVDDTLNSITTGPLTFNNAHKPKEFLPENKNMENPNDNIFNAILRDGERFQKGPLEMVDPNNLYQHLHDRATSQFPHQVDQTRPLFLGPPDHLAHRNSQMKFHDSQHHFPGNVIPHHTFNNIGAPIFDPEMLNHMQVPGDFPPHYPMHQGLPRGGQLSHPMSQMPGHMPEMNNMHNFHLHNQQPIYGGGLGMRLPGSVTGVGGPVHPEALERLFEMEMRANSSKQIHHPHMGPQIPGIYGPENMNFRHR